MAPRSVLDWLLEPDQPAARYRALRELEGRGASDPEVRSARAAIPRRGWAKELLAGRSPEGWWVSPRSYYEPKYLATNWPMLVLADLGIGASSAGMRRSAELWMGAFPLEGGGVGGNSRGQGHHCVVGNLTRALLQLGYRDDARVRRSLEWLVETASPLGGWSCWGTGRNLDSWEGLSAFAHYPRSRWTGPMSRCVERAVEFFLERELWRQGERYAPWFRFHYPVHYYYDLLVGLDMVTRLGYTDDPRMRSALGILRDRRRSDGRWNLDANHPDVEGGPARFYAAHPKQRPTPLVLEAPGQPSKMITLTALGVLGRVEGTQ